MNIFGVGPIFVLLSAVYTVAALVVRRIDPDLFALTGVISRGVQVGLGLALLAVGVPFFFWALVILNRGFPKGKLFTGGPYAACRHPIYGSWIVFNVPGIVLLVGTWLGLLVPVLMYITLCLLVRSEERWLEQTFGEEYLTYKDRTPAVLPRLSAIFRHKGSGKG